jgi:hypothetical protein
MGLDYWYLAGLWCGGLGRVLAGGKLSVRLRLSSTAIDLCHD